MDNTETKIVFEHPLNEKMRTWLRIEFLIKQIEHNQAFEQHNALLFFHALGELLEIVERNDIRGDLIKDIEEQKQKLTTWLNVPGVDTSIVNDLISKLTIIINELITNPKLGQDFKEDRFITSIRKRLSIPGGCCSFDLPSLHLWLQYSPEDRSNQIAIWLLSFSTLRQAISTYMKLVRESCIFKSYSCVNSFHQNSIDVINLLRIRVLLNNHTYPQVSGNTNRYSIRFVSLDSKAENKIDSSSIEFELACC